MVSPGAGSGVSVAASPPPGMPMSPAPHSPTPMVNGAADAYGASLPYGMGGPPHSMAYSSPQPPPKVQLLFLCISDILSF